MVEKLQKLATCLPPAILFEKSEKSKSESNKDEKDKFKSFESKINKKDKDSDKVETKIKVFESGTPKEFCVWYENYVELKDMMPLDTPHKQIQVIRSVLKDTYLEIKSWRRSI